MVNSQVFANEDKQSLLSQKWHNIRFLLCDEIEAAGVDIIGKIEANMRFHVPMSNSVVEGLRAIQHASRNRNTAFAGVNIMLFGDFWQLDPTGSKSFMSDPTEKTGDSRVDLTLSMVWLPANPTADSSVTDQEVEAKYHLHAWDDNSRVLE